MCILNNRALKKYIGYVVDVDNVIFKPLFAASIMGMVTIFSYKFLYSIIEINAAAVILAIILAVIVYFVCLLLTKTVGEEELVMIPKGRTLIELLKRFKML